MHRALTKTLCLMLIRMSRIMPYPQITGLCLHSQDATWYSQE